MMDATRGRLASAVLVVLGSAASTAPAHAATPPSGAEVRASGPIDASTFVRVVAASYHVSFQKIVAVDFDHDGDVDVIAAGDHGLVVWINDGAGRLRFQSSPRPMASIDDRIPANAWRDSERRVAETIQNELPSPPLTPDRSRAPPVVAAGSVVPSFTARRAGAFRHCPRPRGPPRIP